MDRTCSGYSTSDWYASTFVLQAFEWNGPIPAPLIYIPIDFLACFTNMTLKHQLLRDNRKITPHHYIQQDYIKVISRYYKTILLQPRKIEHIHDTIEEQLVKRTLTLDSMLVVYSRLPYKLAWYDFQHQPWKLYSYLFNNLTIKLFLKKSLNQTKKAAHRLI